MRSLRKALAGIAGLVVVGCGGRSNLWLGASGDESYGGTPDAISPPQGQGDTGPTGSGGSSGTGASSGGSSSGPGLPPSCAPGGPGMTNCGAGGSGSESCCTSLEVTGGTYYRTYNTLGATDGPGTIDGPPAGGWTDLADPATVSDFRLDKYLVTVGRFRKFVAVWSSGWLPTAGSGKHAHLNGGKGLSATGGGYEEGWDATDWNNTTAIDPTDRNLACDPPFSTWTNTASTQENLPINCVTWYEAYAFCIWDGGFLPSEAEWEYAAAGGSEQRQYPWGSTDPGQGPETADQYAIYGWYYASGSGMPTGVANIAPVGFAASGVGAYGQLDLAGEVWEWNLDWYATPYADPCADCADLTAASTRVVRGGAFSSDEWVLLPPNRFVDTPAYRYDGFGFRCARGAP